MTIGRIKLLIEKENVPIANPNISPFKVNYRVTMFKYP